MRQCDAGDLLDDGVDGQRMDVRTVLRRVADGLPDAALVDFKRGETRLVIHLVAARHPIAQIDKGQAGAARQFDMIQDDMRAKARCLKRGVGKRLNS